MDNRKVELMNNLPKEVVGNISGFKLDAYLVALEGWRRGLKLKWYKDENSSCELARKNISTSGRYFSLSSDQKSHYFLSSRGDKVARESVDIAKDKEATKKIIGEKDVPITQGKTFSVNDKNIFDYAQDLSFPVVIKPAKGSMGKGVYTNIETTESLANALEDFKTRQRFKEIIIEKHYFGDEYRMYVVGDKVIGATNRVPANIQGDGVHTIEELISIKNDERQCNPYLKSKPIKVDYEIKLALKEKNLQLDSVISNGERLALRTVSNLSAGGDPLDSTDELTDEVKKIAIDGLNALPTIPHAGVDVIVDPEDNRKGVILEVNATAEIAFHMFPWQGKGRDVSGAIVDHYFPETSGRKKSLWYFDFHSVLAPLKTWSTDEITIKEAPDLSNVLYGKKFIVHGKVQKTGYMVYVRKHALKRDIQGYAKKYGDNSIEVFLVGSDQRELDGFRKICQRGTKNSIVDKIDEQDVNLEGIVLKLGFEIITK